MKAAYKEPDYESIFRENEGKPLKTLIAIYQGKYVKLFWSVVFFLIKDSPSWISPLVMAAMIDIITKPDEDAVKKIILNSVFIILLTVQNVPTSYIHVYFYAKTIRQVEKELRCALVRKLQQLSISYHTQMESGRLQSKVMRDVEQIENLSSQIFITVLYIVVNIVAALVIVITKSKIVFGFFLAAVPVAVLLMLYFREKVKNYNTAFRKEMEETTVSVVEMMEMIPVAKAHALERRELNKMEKRLVKVADKGFRLDMIQTYFGAWSWVVFQVFRVFCLIFTAFMALNKKISIGDVAMYQSYFGTVVGCIAGIVGLVPVVTKGLESVTSISDIMLSNDIEGSDKNKLKPEIKGFVEFDNVGFKYDDSDEPLFSGLSFKASPGETIAIVGASGAGKTTILNLVIGFMRATEGRVLIDGCDIKEMNLHHYRKKLAVVPQNSILFSGTLRENITYGLDDVSEEELQKVIDAANLRELVDSLPDGLETVLKEHGGNFSGGQKQRISIARAFIRNPRVLILDEATSALDTVSERQIQEAVAKLSKDRTTFVVAHRLSTIRNADKIAVMEKGGMKEFGNYEELMELRGSFYELMEMQQMG